MIKTNKRNREINALSFHNYCNLIQNVKRIDQIVLFLIENLEVIIVNY